MVRTKNLGNPKKMVDTDATPSNPPAAASTVPHAAAKTGDSSLPQRESQPEKPKRIPNEVARKSVRPYKTSTSSSSSSKGSPPPAAISPPASSVKEVAASTPTGPSTRTRAQQASVEKELRSSRIRDKPVPLAKKQKVNPPSISLSSEEEEPMEDPSVDSSDKSVSLHSEKEIPEDIGVSSDSEETELEPEPPLTKSASAPARSFSAAKAFAAAKGTQPMKEPSPDFYANLSDDFLDDNSRLFRKVYVRGHWFSFSEKDISQALQLPENKNVAQSHETLEPSLTRTTFQPSEYFDGVFHKRPKAGGGAAASSSSAAAEIQEVKNEVQLVNNRLAAMVEVQQEMSKQLSTLVKLYGA
ncbi:hypothetical protein CsatB_008295 [Cannabis sativa]